VASLIAATSIFFISPSTAGQIKCEQSKDPAQQVLNWLDCYGSDLSHETKIRIFRTIECESGFNPKPEPGDHGLSHGLVQIHSPSWPEITRAQAEDPIFSINFIISQFRQGNPTAWSCYKKFYGQEKNTGQENNLAE